MRETCSGGVPDEVGCEYVKTLGPFSRRLDTNISRTVIRHGGSHNDIDLNNRLAALLLNKIADSWDKEITRYQFGNWVKKLTNGVLVVMNAVIASAPNSARDSAKVQKEKCKQMIENEVKRAVERLKSFVEGQQMRLTREVAVWIKKMLKGVYLEAHAISGKGSVAKKKVGCGFSLINVRKLMICCYAQQKLQEFMAEKGTHVYSEICKTLSTRLDDMVTKGENALLRDLNGLSKDVCIPSLRSSARGSANVNRSLYSG